MIFSVRANAKINLFLKVLAKRPDRYHDIVTVLQTIDLYDELLFEKSDGEEIELRSRCRDLPLDASNYVWRAIESLRRKFPRRRIPGVRVEIRKNIPIGAGLGGGSADAAATLLALNELFGLELTDAQLLECAAEVGMDVPFLLRGGTMRATGRGEVLEPVPNRTQCWCVVVYPGFAVSTRSAYELVDRAGADDEAPSEQNFLELLERGNIEDVARYLYNTFERVVMAQYPVLRQVQRDLVEGGCLGALLSGSGSSVFGLVADKQRAESLAAALRACYPFVAACATAELSVSRHSPAA